MLLLNFVVKYRPSAGRRFDVTNRPIAVLVKHKHAYLPPAGVGCRVTSKAPPKQYRQAYRPNLNRMRNVNHFIRNYYCL